MAVALRVGAGGLDERAVGTRVGDLFTEHGRMVFAVCRAILRDPDEAQDATQATFLSAHEALRRGAVVRDPGAWLATIARNECRGRVQGRLTQPLPLRVEELAGSVTTQDDLDRRTTVVHLRAAIAALPEKQREAVVLRDLYGLGYGEICVALGVSRPSVEALLFRARRTLRVRLRPVGGVALGVPLAVREGLAQAVPWFGPGQVGAGAPAAAGAGILAKLAWPVAAKIAVGAVALGLTGSAVVELDRGAPPPTAVPSRSPRPEATHITTPAAAPKVVSAARFDGVGSDREGAPPPRVERAVTPPPGRSPRTADASELTGSSRARTAADSPVPASVPVADRTPVPSEPTHTRAATDGRGTARASATPARTQGASVDESPTAATGATTTQISGSTRAESIGPPTRVRVPLAEIEPTPSATPTAPTPQR